MNWVIFGRIALTATFLILAAGGPVAIIILRNFIQRYAASHKMLEARVESLEQWRALQESLDLK